MEDLQGMCSDASPITITTCTCEVICPWYDTAVEDGWHAFVGCTVARESWYWAGLSTVLQSRVRTMSNLADFVFDICRSES